MMVDETVVVVFEVPGMSAFQYDQIIEQLEAAGQGEPDGRLYHLAAERDGGWLVVDVWESPRKFEQFGQTLIPIVQQLGIAPQPQLYPVYNVVR
jgi:hypothetical protein